MIYVMSDIHGNERRFRSVMNQIKLRPEDTLYVLGDVIDRHPGGLRILRTIMSMPNGKMILGNHEYMMLRALGHPYDPCDPANERIREDATEHWYRNGGNITHGQWKRIRKSARQEILQYLHSLPLHIDVAVNGKSYKLVHGAPMDEHMRHPWKFGPIAFAVWKRWGKEDTFEGNYTMVFGHTPTRYYQDNVPMELWFGDRCIGIDCGCGFPADSPEGRLACLRLDDGKVFYSQEGPCDR